MGLMQIWHLLGVLRELCMQCLLAKRETTPMHHVSVTSEQSWLGSRHCLAEATVGKNTRAEPLEPAFEPEVVCLNR